MPQGQNPFQCPSWFALCNDTVLWHFLAFMNPTGTPGPLLTGDPKSRPQTKELGGREARMVTLVRETKLNVDVKDVLPAPAFSRSVPWRGQAQCFHPLPVSCPLFSWGGGCLCAHRVVLIVPHAPDTKEINWLDPSPLAVFLIGNQSMRDF